MCHTYKMKTFQKWSFIFILLPIPLLTLLAYYDFFSPIEFPFHESYLIIGPNYIVKICAFFFLGESLLYWFLRKDPLNPTLTLFHIGLSTLPLLLLFFPDPIAEGFSITHPQQIAFFMVSIAQLFLLINFFLAQYMISQKRAS